MQTQLCGSVLLRAGDGSEIVQNELHIKVGRETYRLICAFCVGLFCGLPASFGAEKCGNALPHTPPRNGRKGIPLQLRVCYITPDRPQIPQSGNVVVFTCRQSVFVEESKDETMLLCGKLALLFSQSIRGASA